MPVLALQLLGRFQVRRDGEEVPPSAFGGRKVRTLLRVLAVRRPDLVPHEVLAEALWPDQQPADPAANLTVLVTRARRALADPEAVVTGPGGLRAGAVHGGRRRVPRVGPGRARGAPRRSAGRRGARLRRGARHVGRAARRGRVRRVGPRSARAPAARPHRRAGDGRPGRARAGRRAVGGRLRRRCRGGRPDARVRGCDLRGGAGGDRGPGRRAGGAGPAACPVT